MSRVHDTVVEALQPHLDLSSLEIRGLLEIPPNPEMGDYAFPCFTLARTLRKAPPLIAQDLAGKVMASGIAKVEAVGGYLNFTLEREFMARSVLERIGAEASAYGGSQTGAGERVVIDFSSPNIAKPFSIAHIRSTVIGHSLSRLWSHLGYDVVRINHLGDWGTQFGKLMVAYERWGDEPTQVERESIKHLLELYVRYHEVADENPSLDDEARAWFKRLEDGDPQAVDLWSRFREISLEECNRIYAMLGVEFDSYAGESFYIDRVDSTISWLDQKGLTTESEGAMVVELGEEMPPFLLKKTDGATLYATRDLAAVLYRWETYQFYRLLYVVGTPQELHFRQVFEVLRKAGQDWVDRCVHVPFGILRFGTSAMSTRKGNVIFLEDVLNEAVKRTREIIEAKNPDLHDKEKVAHAVGVGAIIFGDLRNNRVKNIAFDWEEILSFDGDTGPYVQYTHARSCSLLRKAPEVGGSLDYSLLGEPETLAVIRLLERFPDVVYQAATANEPSTVARYLLDLCRDFNKFYQIHRILGIDPELQKARLALVGAVRSVIATGLYLLGLEAPSEM